MSKHPLIPQSIIGATESGNHLKYLIKSFSSLNIFKHHTIHSQRIQHPIMSNSNLPHPSLNAHLP